MQCTIQRSRQSITRDPEKYLFTARVAPPHQHTNALALLNSISTRESRARRLEVRRSLSPTELERISRIRTAISVHNEFKESCAPRYLERFSRASSRQPGIASLSLSLFLYILRSAWFSFSYLENSCDCSCDYYYYAGLVY